MSGKAALCAIALTTAGLTQVHAQQQDDYVCSDSTCNAVKAFFGAARGDYINSANFYMSPPNQKLSLVQQFLGALRGVPQNPPEVPGAGAIAGCIARNCPGAYAAVVFKDGSVAAAILTYYGPRPRQEPRAVLFVPDSVHANPEIQRVLERWAEHRYFDQLDPTKNPNSQAVLAPDEIQVRALPQH